MKKKSLADKIASILTTAPTHFDPEDDNADNTTATVVNENVDETDEDTPNESQIRKQNINYLADIDERYAGKGGRRKTLSESEDITSDDNDSTIEESYKSEDIDESASDNEEYLSNSDDEDQTNFKTLNEEAPSQVKKGICVKNQMSIWENLLEMRIQVQKCLLAANKMPQPSKYKEIKKESGQELSSSIQKAKNSISLLLDKFLLLQNLLWKQFPEMSKFKSTDDLDNEEIPSDTEEETEKNEDEESPRKKMKLSDFEENIQEKHNLYKDYRNSVIQKWHDKTRLPVMKSNTTPHSIINHIEHTLADKAKLIKKTQLKRTDYTIIGEENNHEEYNTEIFDDNDFYHQLLRELIEVKSVDLTDPVQLGRQWIQLQNLRSKMKRKIDTKATKGRKIRYAVHTKLVNYMAPMDDNLWTDQAKTELFSSLFGKNQKM